MAPIRPAFLPRGRAAALALPAAAIALATASCVPAGGAQAPQLGFAAAAVAAPGPSAREAPRQPLAAAREAEPVEPAAAFTFRAATPLDGMRALDCLAEAVYYEARSESEAGRRAVAQVVLNRVRHPAWPDSVCGVVYQGPLRPGGGCQFTFTCDGSLAVRPRGAAWAEARTVAAAALGGETFAPVGLSTHYHTHEVAPHWAPKLARTVEIGAHRFYRLPGSWGEARAFRAVYAGSEPLPVPSRRIAPAVAGTASVPEWAIPPIPMNAPAQVAERAAPAQPSTVREEWKHSGQWRDDAPAAITGLNRSG